VSELANLVHLKDAVGTRWLRTSRINTVHAVGVGPKEVAGTLTGDLALRVYVERKLATRALSIHERFPATLDGLPVDVVESAPAFVRSAAVRPERQARDPMCAGISIGRSGVRFGTLGAFCRSLIPADQGQVLALSNHHVLAGAEGQCGDPVYQPGPGDSAGHCLRKVGTLLRAWPIEPGIIANRIDAAVAVVSVGHELTLLGDTQRICSSGAAQAGTIVCKFGRTTGQTEGVITDLCCTAVVGFNPSCPQQTATFIGQIRIDRRGPTKLFADAGDSGAVILERGVGKVVGLYFAGPLDGSYGLANHIADITDRLQIEILT
jgi:hypothetical protein